LFWRRNFFIKFIKINTLLRITFPAFGTIFSCSIPQGTPAEFFRIRSHGWFPLLAVPGYVDTIQFHRHIRRAHPQRWDTGRTTIRASRQFRSGYNPSLIQVKGGSQACQ